MRQIADILPKYGLDPTLWRRRCRHAFATVDLRGRTVLDVGAGVGWASFFAAACGAKRVVSVEPEADGSRSSMLQTAEEIRDELGLADVVEIVPSTIEEADIDEQFDVVVMINSINHLNEDACTALASDDDAWDSYQQLMRTIRDRCRPGGSLIVTDCTNRNLFGDLGLRSPLAPTIEWQKHQPPEVWAKLLGSVGFRDPEIAWTPHARLGVLGKLLALHPWLAYLANSHFRLTMTRKALPN